MLTFSGSLFKHASTNSLNCFVQFPVSCGGLFFGIKNNTLIGCNSELGGSPLANSIAVIPRDQISACRINTIFQYQLKYFTIENI